MHGTAWPHCNIRATYEESFDNKMHLGWRCMNHGVQHGSHGRKPNASTTKHKQNRRLHTCDEQKCFNKPMLHFQLGNKTDKCLLISTVSLHSFYFWFLYFQYWFRKLILGQCFHSKVQTWALKEAVTMSHMNALSVGWEYTYAQLPLLTPARIIKQFGCRECKVLPIYYLVITITINPEKVG